MTWKISLIVVTLLGLPGCDFIYGVNRQMQIPQAPDFTCVERIIRAAPGVKDVQYSRTEGGRPFTWTGIKPATDVHTFVYRNGRILGALQVTIKYDGETNFSQHLIEINRKPPQELINGTRPVMRWIEERLEAECGILGLSKSINEYCPGVECLSLDSNRPN